MSKPIHATLLALAVAAGSCFVYMACTDSSVTEGSPDGGTSSGGTSGINPNDDGGLLPDGAPDCVQNPTTYLEIINACTTATKITKNPTLDKLLPDGGLPPVI
jgi:hypothetical protein